MEWGGDLCYKVIVQYFASVLRSFLLPCDQLNVLEIDKKLRQEITSHYGCSRHWGLGQPRASVAVVLRSITVCSVPPLNHLTACNTVYVLPETAFPDYIFQFTTPSSSSLFILSPAHYLRPSTKGSVILHH